MKIAPMFRAALLVSAVSLIPATTAGLAAVDARSSAQFERLATVYQLVKLRYVEKADDAKLEEGAMTCTPPTARIEIPRECGCPALVVPNPLTSRPATGSTYRVGASLGAGPVGGDGRRRSQSGLANARQPGRNRRGQGRGLYHAP